MADKKVVKVAKEYICMCCDYKCFNKTNFEKHLTTAKHKKILVSGALTFLLIAVGWGACMCSYGC